MKKLFWATAACLLLAGNSLYAQLKVGDNLGSHVATKDLDMGSHNIKAANLINSKGVLVGTATTLSNTSIALQVDGADKAILVPRVTDLLNATTPSIPVANAVNGMIVYDLATAKFYHRQNNAWVVYVDAVNYVDRFLPQVILGKKTFKSDSGFVAKGAFGSGAIPELGAGTRMMYYPRKAAFRVGAVDGVQWDDANIGNYSMAMGNNVTAGAAGSSALGNYVTTGTNAGSFILGDNATTTVATTQRANQFVARFAGGFRFYTTADTLSGFFAGPSGVLKYKSDYSSSYDDRSLVDRGYVANNYALKTSYVDRYVQQLVLGQKTFKSDSGFVALGTFGAGIIPVTGAGTRMMWYPKKGAFRAGSVSGTQWDDANIGNYSAAMGNNSLASGASSVAMGTNTNATGAGAIAIGNAVTASAAGAIAIGNTVTSNGIGGIAIGNNASSGLLGGNLVLGDGSGGLTVTNTRANQFMSRYAGGYRFFTSTDTLTGFFAGPSGVLKYKGDYSAAYDARSLVDKAYLDLHFAAKSTNTSGAAPSATGPNSFAVGRGTKAPGLNSFAYGGESEANSNETLAGGLRSIANGYHSVALGREAIAGGTASFALGLGVVASADYSFALGAYTSTSNYTGSFVFSDYSTNTNGNLPVMNATAANQISMRFAGGYRFFTNRDCNIGSQIYPGGSSWEVISDKRMKENFETIDAESFLMKIDTMKIGSWNYKVQDAKRFRHYGPMAQDFHAAFGKDSYGTIGCDTTIASADFDGVNMIAIKGLVNRTNVLTKENTDLKSRILVLEAGYKTTVTVLEEKNEILNQKLAQQEVESARVQAALVKLQVMMEEMAMAKNERQESTVLAAGHANTGNDKMKK